MTVPGGQRARIMMVVNPGAGQGGAVRAGRVAAEVLSGGADLTVLRPGGGVAGSLAALRGAAASQPSAVVVCGGDGMVHLAANVLAGGRVPLGVIPGGSGNDVADVLGLDVDPAAAARQVLGALAAGSVQRIDVGRCDGPAPGAGPDGRVPAARGPATGRAFVGLLYAGFDSAVNDRANRMRLARGAARYDVALAIEAIRLRARRFRVELDGVAMQVPATLVAVGNGPQYGGGKRIAPHARWDDGTLGVTLIGPVSRWTLARLAPALPRAGHVGHPRVRLYEASEVRLDAADTIAYADGEAVGALPIRAWVERAALPVLIPR